MHGMMISDEDRTNSQIIDDDIAKLEAENAAMETKLKLDKRASFNRAAEPKLFEEGFMARALRRA